MRVECIDLETLCMIDGNAAPPMVCMSWSNGEEEKLLVPWEGEDPYAHFDAALRRGSLVVNQHLPFDLGVLCAERPDLIPIIVWGLENGRLKCIKVREQLIRIALGQAKFVVEEEDEEDGENDDNDDDGGGPHLVMAKTRFDLAAIAKRWLKLYVEKEDTWRMSYGLLRGVSLKKWPASAREYPMIDVRVPLKIWAAQQTFIDDNFGGNLPGEIEANCAAFVLQMMKIWGVRTEAEAVARLEHEMQSKTLWLKIGLIGMSLLRKGGTRRHPKAVETKAETQRRVALAFAEKGKNPPLTKPSKKFPDGQISTAKKTLLDSGDKTLAVLAEYKDFNKILTTYIPRYVAKGVRVPICADWNPLVESFRISCAKPNLTNPPRAGAVRECFIARGLYVSADFDQAELRSWAQVEKVMFGSSIMAEAFRQGIDPHLKLAAELLGISLEEATQRYADGDEKVDKTRQFSKEPNFGLIGGMGAEKFAERAAIKGIALTLDESKHTKQVWMNTWYAKRYLDYFSDHYGEKPGTIVHPVTGMIRGGCGYSDGANHMFQHLTAIGTKQALWDLFKECYLPELKSVLLGTRLVIDMHDELFGETKEEGAHLVAQRWGEVMQRGMEKWVRDVPVKCTPVLARRLFKGAKPVLVDGKLVPSKPVKIEGKTKWVADLREEERRAA